MSGEEKMFTICIVVLLLIIGSSVKGCQTLHEKEQCFKTVKTIECLK